MDFTSPDLNKFTFVLLLVVPGVIIIYFRSLFINGQTPSGTEVILRYLTVSTLYQAIIYPMLKFISDAGGTTPLALWPVLVFMFPAIVGTLLGLEVRKGFLRRLYRRIGLNPVHPIPSAWDWKMGDMAGGWVYVTLKSGVGYAGYMSEKSFSSSTSQERDLYIDQLYSQPDGRGWQPLDRSLLICGGEISTIEFISDQDGGQQLEEANTPG